MMYTCLIFFAALFVHKSRSLPTGHRFCTCAMCGNVCEIKKGKT